jgi:hypothetical protein
MSRGFYSEGIDISADAEIAIGADKVPGVASTVLTGVGVNLPVGSSALLQPAIVTLVYPSDAGSALSVQSTSVSDTFKVRITGLDENWAPKSVDVTLNGTAQVNLGGLWSRVNGMRCLNGTNVGQINCVVTSTANIVSYIVAAGSSNIAQIGRHSVPRGTIVQVLDVIGSMHRAGGATALAALGIWLRLKGEVFYKPFTFALTRENAISLTNRCPTAFPGECDIEVRGECDLANTDVLCRLVLLQQQAKR